MRFGTRKQKQGRPQRWKWVAISGLILMILGLVGAIIALLVLSDGSNNVSKRSIRSLESISEIAPRHHRKKHKHYDVESEFGIKHHQLKNHSRWHKVETNAEHEGNKLELYVHFTLKGDDIPTDDVPFQDFGLNTNCLPPYTLGVNLSVPGAGYSVDTGSISTMDPIYAVNVLGGATSWWNELGLQPVFGSRLPWDGVPDDPNNVDGKNQITFGSISPGSVLAYTRVFGYFGGFPLSMRRIIEWDIVFGDASNTLCDAGGNSDCYHYPAIAVHELGHALGEGDVYTSGCQSYTIMFGSRSKGVTFPTMPQLQDVVTYAYLYPRTSIYALSNGTDLGDWENASSDDAPNVLIVTLAILGLSKLFIVS